MIRSAKRLALISSLFCLAQLSSALANDWPQWRYDAARSAASPDDLPDELRPSWVLELPPLTPAWPDQPKLLFDQAYEPIVAGKQLLVGSSYDDSVTAYDTQTGEEQWRFYANGPVRFAPAAWNDRVYFCSDDGYLYCLHGRDGSLAWKFRGGPADQKVLGNERLISAWPARGAPVIVDGTIYFAAGIWPFMGVFLHALDAETGDVVWTNDGDGSRYIKQPHNSDSFAGVAPQGPLVAIGDKLLVPGGRSVPACYDRKTGELIYYQLAENGKKGGGFSVAAAADVLFNGGSVFDLKTEKQLTSCGTLIALQGDLLYEYRSKDVSTFNLQKTDIVRRETVDRKGKKVVEVRWEAEKLAEIDTPELTTMIVAGSRLYAGEKGRLLAYDLPLEADSKIVWQAKIDGVPLSLVAADDKLFAATVEGRIFAFSRENEAAPSPPRPAAPHAETAASTPLDLAAMARACDADEGYCLLVGISDFSPISQLAEASALRIVAMVADAQKAQSLRRNLRAAGIGAQRVAVLEADLEQIEPPPYFASLIVAPRVVAESRWDTVTKLFASLRPFGGAMYLSDDALNEAAGEAIDQHKPAGAVVRKLGEGTFLVREGALPGSANWTHEHADAANTRVSRDTLVKAPLGLLWFGGASNDAILPRHGHGPQPQVVDGRLYIEGLDILRATDIYTGRMLWEARLPGLGKLYNNTAHQPGANAIGTNYIATPEGIYVAYGANCLRFDPATGEQLSAFTLPLPREGTTAPEWSYINVAGDYLIGGSEGLIEAGFGKITGDNDNFSSSKHLTALDRESGKLLWSITAENGFRHNAICIGGGRLYCIDRLSGAQLDRLKRRGAKPKTEPRLSAFDLKSGKVVWTTSEKVFGTWLSYAAEHDVLVESGRAARDTLSDEPKGMRAFAAKTGEELWFNSKHVGPAMIHRDTVLMAGNACDLLTGALRMREHPLTGEPVEWCWSRNYGCNTPMASEHLLTFRSGAAGYFDYSNDGGTGNFGGFRSSCTNNLVVAGGVLSAPDYTRTCTCNYQNQTSLALVPMPEVETWTSFGDQNFKQPIRRLGINLGAPGDRKDASGTLWIDYPSVGGDSPEVEIVVSPKEPAWFRRHSSQVQGDGLAWVAASGAEGIISLKVTIGDKKSAARIYTVRLHFVEPQPLNVGDRTFDIRLQGERVSSAFDIIKEAGGVLRPVVKEFHGVECRDVLTVELSPQAKARGAAVLCGVEILAEGW